GIHPMFADLANYSVLQQLESLAANAAAIGEIGLDPAYPIPLEIQERAFREQIRLAVDHGLPLLIHCRKVFQRVHLILKEEKAGRVGGIMHAFSGSVEMAREFIGLGFAIAISGTVTWNKAQRPAKLARELPLESIVLETDAPDLTPQRYRGEPNQPAYLAEVLQTVSWLRAADPEDVAIQTTLTAERIFRIAG
ncbi:MAG: TatD family hydrolase, partial [Deltaproteobacteria bacterium]